MAAEASLLEALVEDLAGLAERWDRVGADGGRVNTACSTNFRAQLPQVLEAKETLENPAHLRDNRTVIAGMDWVDGRQAAWRW